MTHFEIILKQQRQLTLIMIVIISFLFSGISSVAAGNKFESETISDATNLLATASPESTTVPDQDDICAFSDDNCANPEGLHGSFSAVNEETLRNAKIIILLFWMEDCASCAEVINTVLPDIDIKYQTQVVFFPIELKEIDSVDRFYQMAERFGVPKNNIGVPLMIIGDQVLTGNQIKTDLEKWITKNLENSQYSLLAIPEFANQLPIIIQEKQLDIREETNSDQQPSSLVKSRTMILILGIGIPFFVIVLVGIIMIYKRSNSVR